MEITSTSHQPFEKLALDIVGPLPVTYIPLTDNKLFNLYHLLPLPIKSEKGYLSINPSHKYLALSITKTLYSYFSDLLDC